MTKRETRKELEALSLDLFGNKYTYQKLQRKGLNYKRPDGFRGLLYLDDDGIKKYMVETKEKQTKMIEELKEKWEKEL